MATGSTNAQVAALLKTLNADPTPGNIIQFQTVLGNVSNCAANIGFAYQIDDSASVPGTAVFSGSFTKLGTYDMSIALTDYKGNTYTKVQAYTDIFSIDFGNLASWNGSGTYNINISVTNQAEAACGPYCNIQTAVPPSVRQDILALTSTCV